MADGDSEGKKGANKYNAVDQRRNRRNRSGANWPDSESTDEYNYRNPNQ